MRSLFLTVIALILMALPAFAGQPEARAVALINNCTPKKIDVYDNSLGSTGKTVYEVTCNLPKTTDKDAPTTGPDGLLIGCDGSLCEVMRPISTTAK